MSRYAENTSVSSEKSRSEIEKTLSRYGATSFAYGWQGSEAVVSFEARDRRIRFNLPLPDRNDPAFLLTPGKRLKRSPQQAEEQYEQAVRQKWRTLALAIKAKLEAIEAGIAEFESEFLAYVVLPNGQRAGDWMKPQIAAAYLNGSMPPLLPYHGKDSA